MGLPGPLLHWPSLALLEKAKLKSHRWWCDRSLFSVAKDVGGAICQRFEMSGPLYICSQPAPVRGWGQLCVSAMFYVGVAGGHARVGA